MIHENNSIRDILPFRPRQSNNSFFQVFRSSFQMEPYEGKENGEDPEISLEQDISLTEQ